MAKSGLEGRIFRICSDRDNLRAQRAPANHPARSRTFLLPVHPLKQVRNTFATLMLGTGILLASLCLNPPQAHAADTKWWTLGTFLQPLDNGPKETEQDLRANADAWGALQDAATAAKAGDQERAAASFARAIKLYGPQNPLQSKIYVKHARTLHRLGHHLEAIRTLDVLTAQEPERLEGVWARAQIQMETRQYNQALSDLETLVRLSPNLVGAHMSRGMALYNLRRADQALEAFKDVITAARKRYVAISTYWNSAEFTNSTPDMVTTMLSLLEHDRDMTTAEAHLWLGRTHFRRSRFWAALRSYEKAIKIAPEFELAYKYRGWLNEKMGHIPEARADYRIAANLSQDDLWIKKALRRVR
jgi:tetratricopeptide (TPR) repeat protein